MKFQLIRNATVILDFAGKRFLFDPMLAPKDSYPGFPGTYNSHRRYPTVDLPKPIEEIKKGLSAIIVTHTHADHWDEAAIETLDKDLPIFVQNEKDAEIIRQSQFTDVRVLNDVTYFEGIEITKTPGQHGSDRLYQNAELAAALGETCGIILHHEREKKIYFAGDTIWTDAITQVLNDEKPDIVALNTGDARMDGYGSIIMGKEDVGRAYNTLKNAIILPIHMDAVGHAALTREELKNYCADLKLNDRVVLLDDGETIDL